MYYKYFDFFIFQNKKLHELDERHSDEIKRQSVTITLVINELITEHRNIFSPLAFFGALQRSCYKRNLITEHVHDVYKLFHLPRCPARIESSSFGQYFAAF